MIRKILIHLNIIITFIFISNSFCIDINSLSIKNILISDSEIIITIKGNNTQQILNNKNIKLHVEETTDFFKYDTLPSEILVNGNKIDKIDFCVYNLSSEVNNITIRFNKTLTNCNVMFAELSNITNIYLNNFDFSQVKTMRGMFIGCSNLISLDLSSLDTSSAVDMGSMFRN